MTLRFAKAAELAQTWTTFYLHLDYLLPETLFKRLPDSSETAKKPVAGAEVTMEPAPVVPTMHYYMGCTPTNEKTRMVRIALNTIVPGLLAVGGADDASVHGANPLGANLLLAFVVVGQLAADTAAERVNLDSPAGRLPKNEGEASTAAFCK